MTYVDQWKALSSRIRGLMQAGQLHAEYLAVRSLDTYGRVKRLREQSEKVLYGLMAFSRDYNDLPPPAASAIDEFVANTSELIRKNGNTESLQERVWAALVSLAAFETEMSFLLADVQATIRSRSERAFSHLQRSIVVDEDLRKKWLKAFDDGEVACERLGAVHLLLHGILAFKIDATGARTDLVFPEPIEDPTKIQRFADGLVLTEWKKATKASESTQCFIQARSQAARYAQGPLATTELTGYRYAVVVSLEQVEVPADVIEKGVVYRHINVSVAPKAPSRH